MGEIRHQAALAMEDLEIVGIADPFRQGQKSHGLVIEGDYEKALHRLRPDLVLICTPNHLIPELCVQALEAGSHAFCEKPPGRNVRDVEMMRKAELRCRDRKLMFGFNHRHHPAVQEAKAICNARELGGILWMRGVYGKSGGTGFESSWRNDPAVSGGGILIDQGIHMLDLARFFLGEFEEVEGWLGTQYWKIPVEDNAFVHLRNEAGQVAQIHSSATLWKHTFQVDLGLEDGYLSIRGLLSKTGSYGRETLVVGKKNISQRSGAAGNPPEEVIYYDRDESWKSQMEAFVRCIRENAPVPESTSQDALRLMGLIEKVYRNRSPTHSKKTPVSPAPSQIREMMVGFQAIRQGTEDRELREEQVWPAKAVAKYRTLLGSEARSLYAKSGNLAASVCPACGHRKSEPLFTIHAAKYRSCKRCETWFVSPRPKGGKLEDWKIESAARNYWKKNLLPLAGNARRDAVAMPRALWVRRWLEVDGKAGLGIRVLGESDPDLLWAFQKLGVPIRSDAPTAIWFEQLDREPDPSGALKKIGRETPVDGKIFLTTWLSTGFDVSVLGSLHPAINPLERLNLFSPDGLRRLARRCGWEVAELSTPGILDLQIVRKSLPLRNPGGSSPFLNFLLQKGGPDVEHEFMSFLQANRLSSHGRLVLKKR